MTSAPTGGTDNFRWYHPPTWNCLHTHRISLKRIFLIISLFVLCCIFYFRKEDNVPEPVIIPSSSQRPNRIDYPLREFDKYIFHAFIGACSGLGNQMFRIAALYGIGAYPNVNRTPGLIESRKCLVKYFKEFSETFPNAAKLVQFDVSFI